jgi:predicted phosphoribosyltransferase
MFRNREDAGRRLAERLTAWKLHEPLVLAIPRGGVVTGAVLARALGAELDVVLSRKLRAPWLPEFAIGAIGEDGQVYLNPDAQGVPGLTADYLAQEREYQLGEIARRKVLFRAVWPAAQIAGRSVLVTDDGIATGATMIAALQTVQVHRPYEIIVAVPVASPERLKAVRWWCDEVVCLLCTRALHAIGQFYEDFRPVEDDQVVALLREFATPPAEKPDTVSRT